MCHPVFAGAEDCLAEFKHLKTFLILKNHLQVQVLFTSPGPNLKAFSPSVERRALRTLRQLCLELLQRCPEALRRSDARLMAEPERLQRLPTKDRWRPVAARVGQGKSTQVLEVGMESNFWLVHVAMEREA